MVQTNIIIARITFTFSDIFFFHTKHLDLSGNKIRSMNGLQGHVYLADINLEDNEVYVKC